MNKDDKVIIFYLISIPIIAIVVIIYVNVENGNFVIVADFVIKDRFVKIVEINKKTMFDVMADPKNYPKVLPRNVISVKIINQTNNTIYAEETVTQLGMQSNLFVKHTIFPGEKQILKVIGGDANDTQLVETFEDMNSSTKITTELDMHVKGFLLPIRFIPINQLEHAIGTVIDHFAEYAKNTR